MSIEGQPQANLERYAWRGTGFVLALDAVKIVATMSNPYQLSEGQILEFVGVSLLIPAWYGWGEGRGWLKEDVGKAISSTKSLLGFKK